jgi:ribosome maturation factor RimP
MSNPLIQKIEAIIKPIINSLDTELYSVSFIREGKNYYLRVYIYKMEREIEIDDCALISEAIGIALDGSDLIKQAYFLEVASPGAERALRSDKEILSAIGKNVLISLKEPINKELIIEGKLSKYNNNQLIIENESGQIEVPESQIKKIRLKIQF